ncbi:MAG: hypothetical protein QGH33_02210, partial [Pirellulaceae bacterium]|nr:hypothetical protein [Pirellulaceae bacterium]
MDQRGNRQGLRANIVSLIAAVTIVGIVRFTTNCLVAWKYGPIEHGRFALVFQFVSMLLVVGELGIVTSFGVRQIALAAAHRRTTLNQLINNLSGTLLLAHLALGVILFLLAARLEHWLHADSVLLRLASIWLIGFGL